MKCLVAAIAVVLCVPAVTTQAEEPEKNRQRLSVLLKKGSAPGARLSKDEKEDIERLLIDVLPSQDRIGADKQWDVTYYDADKGDLFQVDLKKRGNTPNNRLMWFHILYLPERPETYGSEDFGEYRGMGAKDAHYFILVGHLEIRAVADAEEYRNDEKIKGMLKAFKLKEIEKL